MRVLGFGSVLVDVLVAFGALIAVKGFFVRQEDLFGSLEDDDNLVLVVFTHEQGELILLVIHSNK